MADIIDLKTRLKIKTKTSAQIFRERNTQCLKNTEANGFCACEVCEAKVALAQRLYDLSAYLVIDYTEKSGIELFNTDWIEIVAFVVETIREEIENGQGE